MPLNEALSSIAANFADVDSPVGDNRGFVVAGTGCTHRDTCHSFVLEALAESSGSCTRLKGGK